MSFMKGLKPCPFCGKKDSLSYCFQMATEETKEPVPHEGVWFVHCGTTFAGNLCNAYGPGGWGQQEAAKAWNKRA